MSDLPAPPDFTDGPDGTHRERTLHAYLGYWLSWVAIILVAAAIAFAQPDTCHTGGTPGECPPFTHMIDYVVVLAVLTFFTLLLITLPGALLAKALARRSPMPPAFDGMVAALVTLAVAAAVWYVFIRFVWTRLW